MAESRVSGISKFRTFEEMAEFWETCSLADYDDQTYEVEMMTCDRDTARPLAQRRAPLGARRQAAPMRTGGDTVPESPARTDLAP